MISLTISLLIWPSESFRLSLDDADESGRWVFTKDLWGNNKTSLLCNDGGIGGGIFWWYCCWKLTLDIVSVDGRLFPFILIFIGRGGIGGGVEDILSDEALAPLVYQHKKSSKYIPNNEKCILDENYHYISDEQLQVIVNFEHLD